MFLLLRYILTFKWMASFGFALPVLWDETFSGYLYFPDDCNYLIQETSPIAYYYTAIVIYFIVPSLLLPYLHIHIVYTVCKSYHKVRNSITEQHRNADFWNQIKLSVMLLVVYLGYLLAFLPYFGVFIADLAGVNVHHFAYQMAAYVMNAQSMINVVIYGVMNSEYRQSYKTILCTCSVRGCCGIYHSCQSSVHRIEPGVNEGTEQSIINPHSIT